MKNLKGSNTAKNLLKAFAGESQARNRYNIYGKVADKEGFKQIKKIFDETAENEKEHAKRFYNLLLEGLKDEIPTTIEITADFPVAKGTTLDNLLEAAHGEHEENSILYPEFAKVAKEEGYEEVATAFLMISKAEIAHEKRFKALAEDVKTGKVFKKDEKVSWKCDNCGYVMEGTDAPNICPSCLHPQSYFEVLNS